MAAEKSGSALGMEDNLKKAVTEMLILLLLKEEDMYAAQITATLEKKSNGAITIIFPYAALYRMINFGHIIEAYKKIAPDGRRRQYYQITEAGLAHLEEILVLYQHFTSGIQRLLNAEKKSRKKAKEAAESLPSQ